MNLLENVGRRSEVDGDTSQLVHVGEKSLNGYERNCLYKMQPDGRYADVGYLEGADRIEDARGCAFLDIEGDGDLDLMVANFEQPARLLVNQGGHRGSWLEVRLRGKGMNRDAVGAKVWVEAGGKKQVREVITTAGYLSGQSRMLHFGLGVAKKVDRIIVRWPTGLVSEIRDVEVNKLVKIPEGATP
jgi:hypothetical protein